MYKIFNFENFRIGDKLAGCYQLQYNSIKNGYQYIIFDTLADKLFPIKDYFPSIGQYVIETNNPTPLISDLKEKGYEEINFGNLWISSPSLKKDTDFLPNMILPKYLKDLQYNFNDTKDKKVLDYKIKIINHCLVDAKYNTGRNHNREQFNKLIDRVRKYIIENEIDAIVVDVPINYSWNLNQLMALIELGDLYIGGDTGLTHAYSMFHPDRPIVAIYGDDSQDVNAFESERVKMGCSSSWCSDPLCSNNYKKFVMKNNLFDEEVVFNHIVEKINELNK